MAEKDDLLSLASLVVLVGLLLAACSSSGSPLAELTDAEREYVIPDSEQWGSDPCSQPNCTGTFEAETAECWYEVDAETSAFGDGFFEIVTNLTGPSDDVVLDDAVPESAASWMQDAYLSGSRLIIGTDCPVDGGTITPVIAAIAVDDQGRVASISRDPAQLTTSSLATAAAESGSTTGEEHLLALITR